MCEVISVLNNSKHVKANTPNTKVGIKRGGELLYSEIMSHCDDDVKPGTKLILIGGKSSA